jgi:multiple sugar transport system ATP-binding protein
MRAAQMLQIDHLLDRLPKQLSGGQRQRVAIGRAITRDPRVFLFDEPLSNLDAALRVQTRLEIAKLHHDMRDVTMIYVTHDQVEAMTLADRICVLRDGKVMQVGTPSELYDNPNSVFVAGFIGSPKMNFLDGEFAAAHGCATLGVRSEHIDVVPEGAGIWRGTVINTRTWAADNYCVEVGAKETLIVRQAGKVAIPGGRHLAPARRGMLHRFDAGRRPSRRPRAE